MKVMIVDDNPGIRKMIREFLTAPDVTVCECASGPEAIRRAVDFDPDWVTLDVRMPGSGALETLWGLRSACRSARILIVTSYDEPELRHAAAKAGAVGYLLKENLAQLPALLANPQAKPSPETSSLPVETFDAVQRLGARIEEAPALPGAFVTEFQEALDSLRPAVSSLQQTRSPSLGVERQRCARQIGEVCERMAARLETLLTPGSIEPAIESKPISTQDVVRACWEQICTGADRSQFRFTMERLPDVQGDTALVRMLFLNLLRNAMKFSARRPEPSIEITGCATGARVVFALTDNGAGFDLSAEGQLFQPLGRLHPPADYPGLGLGLVLARRVVQLHGGRIWVKAAPDKGATFYVTLPRAAARTNQ